MSSLLFFIACPHSGMVGSWFSGRTDCKGVSAGGRPLGSCGGAEPGGGGGGPGPEGRQEAAFGLEQSSEDEATLGRSGLKGKQEFSCGHIGINFY